MITVPASGWAFCFLRETAKEGLALVTGNFSGSGGVRCSAVCVLILTLASVPVASAGQQDATGDTPPSKSSSKTSAHHKTSSAGAAKASGTAHRSGSRHSSRRRKSVRGQKKIDSERARTIQEALIREHYLSGEPTGIWNEECEDAMRRYQSDNGWQTKEAPDARALIKLGLGPSKDHLLNPESAMTTGPDAPRAATQAPPTPVSPAPTPTPAQNNPTSPQ
jgi:Putative peptidoglycan binding domain